MCSVDIFLGLLAILFPPLAVWVKSGICSADSLINILLCTLGFLPALLHVCGRHCIHTKVRTDEIQAWYIIAKYPENDYESIPQDAESGRVTYIVVNPGDQRVPKQSGGAASRPQNAGYGTTAPMNPPAVHQDPNGTWNNEAAAGSSAPVPPTYAEATRGDHKIQNAD